MSPLKFGYRDVEDWLGQLARVVTHWANHYDLVVSLEPDTGGLEVQGTVRLRPVERGTHDGATGGPTGDPGRSPCEVRFLLNSDLKFLPAPEETGLAEGNGAGCAAGDKAGGAGFRDALRTLTLAPGQVSLALHYHGRLPQAWISPRASELALYNLWFPIFGARPEPFTFRVVLRVPPMTVPAMNGRLVPLPPELVPRRHDDVSPRAYVWESAGPVTDIDACVGPYLVHEGGTGGGRAIQVYATADDYDLGQRLLEEATGLSGQAPDVLRIVVPPVSNWGRYSRPGYIVLPSPLAAGGLGDLASQAGPEPRKGA